MAETMIDYTRLINTLSSGHEGTEHGGTNTSYQLSINATTKTITPTTSFNPLIGLTNEINSSVLSFKFETGDAGVSLENCEHKQIKWANQASGEKGLDTLVKNGDVYTWAIPAEALTKAGSLKVSITVYDTDDKGNTTFRWNSLPFTNLTVGQGMDEISTNYISDDSIIYVDLYTRKINIPSGLNTQIGMVGEQLINMLKFRCDRYFLDLDFANEDYKFYLIYQTPGETSKKKEIMDKRIITDFMSEEGTNTRGDLLEFNFSIPSSWTEAAGNISFALQIVNLDEFQSWKSETNTSLRVGSSLTDAPLAPDDETVIRFEDLTYVFEAGDASEFYD